MTIPIILLNYNSANDCRKCVGFLKKQQGVDLDIIIVDNASKEEDKKTLREFVQEENAHDAITSISLIESKENRGYNAGNNVGLRYAAEKGYEFALIANPDMEFHDSGYVKTLLKEMEADPVAVVAASDIVTPEGIHQNPMLPDGPWTSSFGWIKGLFKKPKKGEAYSFIGDFKKSGYCAKVSGCALLIRMDFIKSIGFFDEYPFLYCEEAILAKQAEHAGKKMLYVANTSAIHRHIKSEKGDPRPRYRQWKRSRLYFFKKYSGYSWYGKVLSSLSWRIYMNLMIMLFGIRRSL